METKKLNVNDKFQNLMQLQKEMMEPFQIGNNTCTSILHLDELFEFLNKHIEEFHEGGNVRVVLTFVHHCIKVWISRKNYLNDDVGILLTNLIVDHYMNEVNVNIALQIVYQVMNSIKVSGTNDVPISEKLLRELIAIVPLIKSRSSAANCIACIHKYMEMFPESWRNLGALWSCLKHQIEINLINGITNEIEIDILIQFIDNFKSLQSNLYDETVLISLIQHLLESDQRKFRKCGYYLLKKLFSNFMENVNSATKMWMSFDHNQQIEKSWRTYVTILENIEEEQSHLILPSLEHLEELVNSKNLPSTWLNILYVRILNPNNNLVLRFSIEFFLRIFTCSNLCEEILKHLLQATNSNSLFNYDGYFLKTDYFSSFLKGDVTIILRLLYLIENWKSVPLYVWLENINKRKSMPSLTFEEILKIASCIRNLQNKSIREKAIKQCQELFQVSIEKMTMKEYVTYIETLYNASDTYGDHKIFYSKKSSLIESEPGDSIYKKRFYDIFTNSVWMKSDLLSFLKDVPVEKHGWLKFAVFNYKLGEHDIECISNLYKLDLNASRFSDIYQVIKIFKNALIDSLSSFDKYELIECEIAAISFYIHEKDNFHTEDKDTLHFILSSEVRNVGVIAAFAKKLLNHKQEKIELCFVDKLLKYKSEVVFETVAIFLNKFYDENVIAKYIITMLKKLYPEHSYVLYLFKDINALHSATDAWIQEIASQGDNRIENAFSFNHFNLKNGYLIDYCLLQIKQHANEKFVHTLLEYHTNITKKKPRYFENSSEHRAKLRIAICIYKSSARIPIMSSDIMDKIWNILLDENNQLNITYIYESILGIAETRENVIINKLKMAQNFTPSQQVSIISVAYKYFKRVSSTPQIQNTVVYTFLSLTMGPNFQTRLLAQVTLHQLLKEVFERRTDFILIMQSIEDAFGTKLEEYVNDVRIVLSELSEKNLIDVILYVTNAPFDEIIQCFPSNDLGISSDLLEEIKCLRARHLKKFKGTKNDDTALADAINYQIQRKINPVNDLTESHNLIAYPIEEKSVEMVVVASLIDKLPNLGGIARTCEVLGIKNLVLDSKMIVEKDDFKNLSMTAEKTLNILEVKVKDLREFLTSKKVEGFIVVGAEQTSKSQHFENFKFPEKCVLVLGHEKDGIPAPLLGLLDNTVEVPQFGQVRSLNVHVTGALFMWEFCKQHLVKQ